MLLQLCTVMASRAPALALATTGDSGAEFFAQQTTPVAPKKCADRSTAPRFCCINMQQAHQRRDAGRTCL